MSKNNVRQERGIVLEILPGPTFKIQLDDGQEIIGYLAGKLRIHKIKILPGDKVTVEMTPYDKDRARIVYRK
ncbi:MAG: translation initiation factor IF-1 [Candidatus Pacebacteria bacterium]|nr:translation initiation factor IF-1 [Candidatus Paceibacterota bacterium]